MTIAIKQKQKQKQNFSISFPFTESLLLLVAIVWGTSYGVTKSALGYTSVVLFISIRFSATSFCLLPFVINDIVKRKNKDWLVSIPTGLILAAIFFCEVLGVSQTTASNAAFLISLNVVFTAIAQSLITKEKPSLGLFLLCMLSVLGVVLITSSSLMNLSLNSGDYYIITASVLRALMVTTTQHLTKGKQVANTTLTFIQSLIVACCALIALSTEIESINSIPTNLNFWISMAYLILFCTLLAFFIQNYAVRKISPTKASLLMGSEPMFGALFAFFWLGESFTFVQGIGALLILISVTIAPRYHN